MTSETSSIDFETALDRIVERFKQSIQGIERSRSYLVVVYGWPNHGKSYLMTRLQQCFEDQTGIDVSRYGGTADVSDFQNLARQEKDVAALPSVRGRIVLYHCGWEKGPNYLTEIHRRV